MAESRFFEAPKGLELRGYEPGAHVMNPLEILEA